MGEGGGGGGGGGTRKWWWWWYEKVVVVVVTWPVRGDDGDAAGTRVWCLCYSQCSSADPGLYLYSPTSSQYSPAPSFESVLKSIVEVYIHENWLTYL